MENLFREETKKTKKRKKAARSTLSFALDDEEAEGDSSNDVKPAAEGDGDEPPVKRSKLKKNPNVDTSFLPDRDREEAERRERERLRLEWLTKQEQTKKEDIEVTYSYWDGSGHRKTATVSRIHNGCHKLSDFRCQCKKGDTIAAFLEKCRLQFPELRGVSVDNLVYVKVEDNLFSLSVFLTYCF